MSLFDTVVWMLVALGVFAAGSGVLTEAVFKVVRGTMLLPHCRLRQREHSQFTD